MFHLSFSVHFFMFLSISLFITWLIKSLITISGFHWSFPANINPGSLIVSTYTRLKIIWRKDRMSALFRNMCEITVLYTEDRNQTENNCLLHCPFPSPTLYRLPTKSNQGRYLKSISCKLPQLFCAHCVMCNARCTLCSRQSYLPIRSLLDLSVYISFFDCFMSVIWFALLWYHLLFEMLYLNHLIPLFLSFYMNPPLLYTNLTLMK